MSVFRRLSFWIALAGVMIGGIGAKWQVIARYGSDVPYMDQWNGEAEAAIQPWLNDRFDLVRTFWAPHNEHRIGWTRLWALALTLINGQWDPLFATTLNALVHVGVAAGLLLLLRPMLAGPGWWLGPVALLAVLATPIGWENTISAFQVQFYFVAAAAVLHLHGTIAESWRSWRWWLGLSAGIAGLATMSSSFLAPAAVIGTRIVRSLSRRTWTATDTSTVIACAGLVLTGVLAVTHVPAHDRLRSPDTATFVLALTHILAFPVSSLWPLFLLMQGPLLWWGWTRLRDLRREWTPAEWLLLGFSAWLVLMAVSLAYARGNHGFGTAPRYADTYSLFLVANCAAMGALWHRCNTGSRARPVLAGLACVWAAFVAGGLAHESRVQHKTYLETFPSRWEEYAAPVRSFVAAGDEARFRAVPTRDLPFVDHAAMLRVLGDPAMRRVLPARLRLPVVLRSDTNEGFLEALPENLSSPDSAATARYADGSTRAVWASVPVETNGLQRILRFTFAGDPRLPPGALRLEADDGREALLEIPGFHGTGWQRAHLFVPPGAKSVRVRAEAGPGGAWLAFLEPLEVGFGSWLAHQLRKQSEFLTWLGIGLLVFGLALLPPTTRPAADGLTSTSGASGPVLAQTGPRATSDSSS